MSRSRWPGTHKLSPSCIEATRISGRLSPSAALVNLNGILGAVIVIPPTEALRMWDFAAGLDAQGIDTAWANTVDTMAGTFTCITTSPDTVLTAVLAPTMPGLLHWGPVRRPEPMRDTSGKADRMCRS